MISPEDALVTRKVKSPPYIDTEPVYNQEAHNTSSLPYPSREEYVGNATHALPIIELVMHHHHLMGLPTKSILLTAIPKDPDSFNTCILSTYCLINMHLSLPTAKQKEHMIQNHRGLPPKDDNMESVLTAHGTHTTAIHFESPA